MWKWVRGRFLSIGMALGICFLLLVSLVVDAGLGVVAKHGSNLVPGAPLIMQAAGVAVSFCFVTLLFVMLLKYLPDTRVACCIFAASRRGGRCFASGSACWSRRWRSCRCPELTAIFIGSRNQW